MTFSLQHINDLCRHNNPCFSPVKWPNWPKSYRIPPIRRMQSHIMTQTPSNKCTSYNTFLAVSIYIFDYKKTKTLPNCSKFISELFIFNVCLIFLKIY